MKKSILALALVAACSGASADQTGDFRLGVTLGSKHFIDAPEDIGSFCESNLGLEVEYQVTDSVHIAAGRYRNSVCSRSTFIGAGIELESGVFLGAPLESGLEFGMADGYEAFIAGDDSHSWPKHNDYLLMGGPYLRFGDKHSFKLRYLVVLMTASYQYGF